MSESNKEYPISSSKKRSPISGQTPTVIMVRHGDTAMNSGHTSPERFRSHIDIPLSAEGRQEAKDLAKNLRKEGIECVYSSDLQRAVDTAEAIAEACGADHIEDERLRPWDLGKLAGTPVKDGIAELKRYVKMPDQPLPGGESFNAFKERYLSALDEILDEAVEEEGIYCTTTHTRNLQLTKASYAVSGGLNNHDIDLKTFEDYSHEVSTGDILKLEYRQGSWEIIDQEKG